MKRILDRLFVYNRRFLFVSWLVLMMGLASCQASGPAVDSSESAVGPPSPAFQPGSSAFDPESPVSAGPERIVPSGLVPPAGYLNAVERQTRTADGRPGEGYWQQHAAYELNAMLDPSLKRLRATAGIWYFNNSGDRLDELHLELVQNFHAEGVPRNRPAEITGGMQFNRVMAGQITLEENAGGAGAEHGYRINGTRMLMRLPEPLEPGDSTDLFFEYSFNIPESGAGGRMGHSRENVFFLGYWYPHMVVYDDVVGWHPDPFLGTAEFYHGFADYRACVRAPEEWIVMATGDLLNAREVLSDEVYRRWKQSWESDEPVRVYSAGSGPFHRQGGDHEGWLKWCFSAENVRDFAFSATRESHWETARTPVGDRTGDGSTDYTVINTFWREEAPLWSEVTAYQQHAISFLSEMTGYSYPWSHMTAVEGEGILSGGMEYPMITVMGDYNQRGYQALYSVTAHELAHMWIPLIVSTDERRYSWLDEGNTVFSTAEAILQYHPERNPHEMVRSDYLNAVRHDADGRILKRSDFHYSQRHFVVASYRKPAAVLVALRKVLGDEIFWEAYRAFIRDWAFKQAYPWDFFRTFERISGRDLGWFWQSWYDEQWVLNQSVYFVEALPEGTRLIIRDKGEVPMPVWLRVTLEDGSQADYVIPVDAWLAGRRTVEKLIPEIDVIKVEIDPDGILPDVNRQNMIWRR